MDVGRAGQEGARPKKRTGTSKYDFFKVKVWLGENMDHYYVLSRFLICRMLTVTKIPYIKAVKIALETKKYLVDNNLQDVTQMELENVLFSIVRAKGFDEQYIDCYRMVTQFYQQRQPLCILICGTSWTGKSSIAQQLASRINIPNVMQTDVIYELLRASGDSPLHGTPLWCRPALSDAALVAEFRREARVVRKGMDGDLIKTLSDGKPIIIEGMHLDPGLYIQDFQRRGIIMLPARPAAAISPARPARTAAAAAAGGSPQTPQAAGFRRSMTSAPRRAGAADAAAAAAVALQEQGSGGGGGGGGGSDRVSLAGRSWSADPEMLARPAGSPAAAGSSAAAAAGGEKPRLLTSPELECSNSTSSCDATHQQMQPQPQEQQQDGQQLQQHGTLQQHEQQVQQAEALQQPQQAGTQAAAAAAGGLAPAQGAAAGAAAPGSGTAGACSSSSANGAQLQAAIQPAAAATAAVQDTLTGQQEEQQQHTPGHSRPASPSYLPAVMMLDELQVCAATAEAMALLQHRQNYQQQQQQQGLPNAPGSPYSSIGSEAGPACGSPALSMEHSTTEVVSRQPSCCSPLLSQEPSAPDVGSSSGGAAAGASSSGGSVLPGSASPCTLAGSSAAVHRLSRSKSWQQMQPPDQVQQQQQQQQDVLPDIVAQRLLEQQQQQRRQPQQHAGSPVEQLWESANHQQQQAQPGSSGCNGAAGAEHRESIPAPNSSSNGLGLDSSVSDSAGVASVLLQQQGAQQSPVTVSLRLSQQQQQQRHGLPPLPPLPPQQPRSPLAGRLRTTENQQENGISASSAVVVEADRATAAPHGKDAAPAAPAASIGGAVAVPSDPQQQQQQQQAGDNSRTRPDGDLVQRPLFVPILVYMDEADHVLMQEEALSHLGMFNNSNSSNNNDTTEPSAADAQAGAAADAAAVQFDRAIVGSAAAADGSSYIGEGAGAAAAAVSSGEALRRMRLLQEYLCAYEAQGLPVVKVTYGNFGEALDKLHEYILQCIKCAMTESGQL